MDMIGVVDAVESLRIAHHAARVEQAQAAFCAVVGLAAAVLATWLCWRGIVAFIRRVPRGRRLPMAVWAVMCAAYGGTKIRFPQCNPYYELIRDAGSEATADGLVIRYVRHRILPDDADFQVWARPGGSTNAADYAALVVSTVGECPSPYTVDLTGKGDNLDIIVFTTWMPAPSVHTNGTLVVKWAGTNKVDNAVFAVPRGTSVHENGAQIAPPERSR